MKNFKQSRGEIRKDVTRREIEQIFRSAIIARKNFQCRIARKNFTTTAVRSNFHYKKSSF